MNSYQSRVSVVVWSAWRIASGDSTPARAATRSISARRSSSLVTPCLSKEIFARRVACMRISCALRVALDASFSACSMAWRSSCNVWLIAVILLMEFLFSSGLIFISYNLRQKQIIHSPSRADSAVEHWCFVVREPRPNFGGHTFGK